MADFIFDVYRLNIVDDDSLLGFMGSPMRRNEEIIRVLNEATNPRYDVVRENPTSIHKWSLRDFFLIEQEQLPLGQVVGVTLARSILEKQGPIVTDTGIEQGVSEAEPPLASFAQLVFYMNRHLVAVEYNSNLMASDTWRDVLHEILIKAATELQFRSAIRLMPLPSVEEVLSAFHSFDRLTRLRARLLVPNPELTRYSKKLFDDLKGGNIRELLVDMRNHLCSSIRTAFGNDQYLHDDPEWNGSVAVAIHFSGPIERNTTEGSKVTVTNHSTQLVQKLWNYCNILRDDGLSYGDYVEQLTFLLFLKMVDEQSRSPFNKRSPIPEKYSWAALLKRDGDELEIHYRHTLEELGKEPGLVGVIFRKAQNAASACKR